MTRRPAFQARAALAGAALLALTLLPACALVVGEDHWNSDMAFGDQHFVSGHSNSKRLDELEHRIAALEEQVDHCPMLKAAAQDKPAEKPATPAAATSH